jgi:hypothetical protein
MNFQAIEKWMTAARWTIYAGFVHHTDMRKDVNISELTNGTFLENCP